MDLVLKQRKPCHAASDRITRDTVPRAVAYCVVAPIGISNPMRPSRLIVEEPQRMPLLGDEVVIAAA